MSANRIDKAIGLLLGAAAGDALGWPQEDRSQIVGGQAAREIEPRPEFRAWERNAGTRFARYVEPVGAGEYSDDTQLMLAVARSCLRGANWSEWLRGVELPVWPVYQRGGGGAVLGAARSWQHGKEPWSVASSQEKTAAVKYFSAGSNGAAMRIAPHAVVTASQSVDELIVRVLLDALSTHGHPRALLGACIHALAIRYVFLLKGTLEYGELLDYLMREPAWRDPHLLLEVISPEWIESYKEAAYRGKGYHPAEAWVETAHEVEMRLADALEGLRRGALANDNETLEKIGCFDRESGSGTVAAIAASYVAARTATRPMSGLLRTGFLRNADTDTIASMTGSLLGAIHGHGWLNGLASTVQDHQYLRQTAIAIAEVDISEVVDPSSSSPTSLTSKQIREWSDELFRRADADAFPDGRAFRVTDFRQLSTKTNSFAVRIVGRAGDGQTLFVDHVSKKENEAFRRAKPLAEIDTESRTLADVRTTGRMFHSPRFVRVEVHVHSLDMSRQFYRDVLQMSCDLRDEKMYVGDSLVLSLRHSESDSSAGDVILTLAVADLHETAAWFDTIPDLKFSWGRGSDTLWLPDPDGNKIRIIGQANT